ncbi:MAG: hypothetical protein PHS31_05705 [Victivallaceae bacterium]|nr:hypothetical protein [Victivallaceae bacterium]
MNNVLKKQIFVSCIIFIAMLFTFIGNAEDIHFSKIQYGDLGLTQKVLHIDVKVILEIVLGLYTNLAI